MILLRRDTLKTEQNWKVFQAQAARIKQTIEKVLDEDKIVQMTQICTLSCQKGIKCVFGGGSPAALLSKRLWEYSSTSQQKSARLAGKAVEALPAIMGDVVGVILSFLGKAAEFVPEYIWVSFCYKAYWDMVDANNGKAEIGQNKTIYYWLVSERRMKNIKP